MNDQMEATYNTLQTESDIAAEVMRRYQVVADDHERQMIEARDRVNEQRQYIAALQDAKYHIGKRLGKTWPPERDE